MATALDTFQALKDSVPLTDNTPPREAFDSMRLLLSRIQHQVLSSQHDALRRQMLGILFSHAQHLYDLPEAFAAPEAWTEKTDAPDRGRRLREAAVVLAVLLLSVCFFHLYTERAYLLLLTLAAGCVLLLFAYLSRPARTAPRVRLTQRIDAEKLLALTERAMQSIDRDMEALSLLLPSDAGAPPSPDALDLAAKLLEMASAGRAPLPAEIAQAAHAYLARSGIELADYTEHNAPLFQALPTRRDTRTIVPAMLLEGRLVREGLAILHTAEGGKV